MYELESMKLLFDRNTKGLEECASRLLKPAERTPKAQGLCPFSVSVSSRSMASPNPFSFPIIGATGLVLGRVYGKGLNRRSRASGQQETQGRGSSNSLARHMPYSEMMRKQATPSMGSKRLTRDVTARKEMLSGSPLIGSTHCC